MEKIMECAKVQELLPFLDGGSPGQEKTEAVRNHLDQCEVCRREYHEQNEMLRTITFAYSQNTPEYTPDFLRAVKNKIRRKNENRVIYKWVYSAAAVIVIAFGLTLYSQLSGIGTENRAGDMVYEDTSGDFDNYVASKYLDSYELSDLIDESYTIEDQNLLQSFISTNFFDITTEDIIDTFDEDEIELVLASF